MSQGIGPHTVAQRTWAIGRQSVIHDHGRWWLTITNRTYASRVEVPEATALRYAEAMGFTAQNP